MAEDPVKVLEPFDGECIALYTSYVSNQLFEVHWRQLETLLRSLLTEGKGKGYQLVDGAAPEHKELRSTLWSISEKREYPLVFIQEAGTWKCMGVRTCPHSQRSRCCQPLPSLISSGVLARSLCRGRA